MMFTGTNQQQDTRFSDKEKKLMKQMKFGDCLNKRVDMSKVKLDVLRPWISKKITDILHIEDDVVVEFVYNQLEEEKYPCPKKMQINMTGFLNGKNARQFMGELWTLLLSAQESESGIPAEFIQQKKDEILRREEELRQEQLSKRDRSRTPFEKDRDREKDRGSRRDRSGRDRSKERAMHPDMPASTLTAIEQVRCQLKSRSNSTETNNLSNVAAKNNSTEGAARNRSKSPKVKAADSVAKSRNRSRSRDRRHSRDRSSPRASGERNSPPSRRRTSRDRDRRRSPKRRSVDRKRRSSRSRDRSSRQFHSSHRRSRSHSPQKRSDNVNANTSRRSIERRSKSASPGKRKQSPKSEARKCSPTPAVAKPGVNGIDTADSTSEKKLTKVQGKLFELAAGTAKTKSRSRSRSRSRHASPTTDKKMKNSKSRSRSLPKKRLRERSSSHRTSSSCRSSPASGHKKKLSRSVSRGSRSPTHSPENRRDDFEITKSKNSVQKKRHYRNNRNSSSGSSVDRTMDDRVGEKRRDGYRRASPRGRSPQNRNQRSRSGRRSRSRSRSRSRMRNRSRSPMRRSRSPRRFNRRWSPNFHHFRGRGGLNRGRMNHWRRSHSRGRGRNMSPQRRFSPQRRYSRDRRSPQMQMQYRDRKFSPARRYSPQPQARRSRERRPSSRDRRPLSRDRRPSSPMREFSRERRMSRERRRPSPLYVADFGGRSKPKTDNRWEMSSARGGQKPKQRVSSESSNWEESDQEEIKNKGSPKKSSPAPSRSASPIKSTERREKSKSRSQERHKKMSSPAPKALVGKDKSSTAERSSIEYSDTVVKTTDVSKQEKERDDYKRKTKSDILPEIMSKQPSLIAEQQQLEPCRSKEVSRAKYSLSLSRTPSPFLKPHEREKAGQVAATHKKPFDKKTEVIPKTNVRDTESSSSDSSDSDDSDEEEKTVFPKKTEMRASKARKFSDSDRSVGEKKVPMKGKRAEHKTAKRDGNSHKNSVDTRAKPDNSSASRAAKVLETSTSSDPMDRSVPSTELKRSVEERRRIVSSVDTDYDGKTKPNEKASRKRTLSISDARKQDHNTTDSDYDQALKKKRKKNKKIVKRNSDNDSSESEGEIKKKKHKKHKKHSKKNKKHKKHKKKSKKADNTSSSDEESDNKVAKIEPRGRFPTGINEDLEKQLRERALKSMKKID